MSSNEYIIEDLWYKNTVIYSLDLETFMDANGDGIGDFEGLIRRLDYLQGLGIGAVWLGPFQPTPNRDNGYDISDYYGVDQRHGSSGDFVEFMHRAKEKGIAVLIDLVVNHTSDKHPWFQAARKSKDSKFHDWYVWSKKRPEDWNTGMVFPGVQDSTWTYDKQARQYYFHRFFHFQPDLNTHLPEVRTEIRRIMGYWIQQGVAGFRLDAVPFILEVPIGGEEVGLKFEYLYEMRAFLQWRKGNGILLGEANVLPEENVEYFGPSGNGLQMMFNFFVNQFLFYALATEDSRPLIDALEQTRDIPAIAQWSHFLRNHDELDLGRLSDEQRESVFAEFGPSKKMQLYHRGIRRRLAPMLGQRKRLELAYSLIFSLPGTPMIRYGDEIGMGDDLTLKERDAVRTPMQWSDSKNAGFSDADKTIHPVISKGPYSYHTVNVESQRRDPDSMLNWMAALIRLRKETPEIGWGNWRILKTPPHVLAIGYEWRKNALLIVHNFRKSPTEIRIDPHVEGDTMLTDLIENKESLANAKGEHVIDLPAYGYRWFRVGPLDHLLRRRRA